MTTLELISNSPPYMFKSLGVYDPDTRAFVASNDFPSVNNTKDELTYELTEGKFPLTDYTDMFSKSGLYHTLNNNIKVKITGFDISCYAGKINEYGSCKITVEKEATDEPNAIVGGRKNKSNRRKTNRRKSNRRKTNRRKTNRRR